MMNTVVLGIGNVLLMDDGLGVNIVEKLREQPEKGVMYVAGETDIDYCIDMVKDADYLIIIDAAQLGSTPGHITVHRLDEVIEREDLGFSMHSLHLFDMLAYSKSKVDGVFIGIEAYRIDYKLGLSSVINGMLKEITDQVRNIIKYSLLVK